MKNLAILLILGLTLCGCHKSGTNSAIKLRKVEAGRGQPATVASNQLV
jgi:ABC-type uncharacterized transport system auxiliary subunit